MSGHEPGRLDTKFIPKLQETINANSGPEYTTRNIGRARWTVCLCIYPNSQFRIANLAFGEIRP
jgi:hypothetical protein